MKKLILIFTILCLTYTSSAIAQRCNRCGSRRWSVKTLSDPDATRIDFDNIDTKSVSELISIRRPARRPPNGRVSAELKAYEVTALLLGYFKEADQDYHLVIADPRDTSKTMVAEVPSPNCQGACRTDEAQDYREIRQVLEDQLGSPGTRFRPLARPKRILLQGVAFFDSLSHSGGEAPNGIELHPIFFLEFQ